MASSSKQKTTWSKLQRESALREKRDAKAARKVARRLALDDHSPAAEFLGDTAETDAETHAETDAETEAGHDATDPPVGA